VCAFFRPIPNLPSLPPAYITGGPLLGGQVTSPTEAIVRFVFKATVVNVEVKKPAGKWEKIAGAPYGTVEADFETGLPRGLGLETIPSIKMLMQENKDRLVFERMKGVAKA
jgi:hypothetical protein